MRALADTQGMTVPERAEFWLHGLAWCKHKGRHDTWSAARDRAAQDAGVPLSIAKRIWQRWHGMSDVGGEALLRLMLAYEKVCERNEAAAEAYRQERLKLKAKNNAVDNKPAPAGVGMGASEMGAMAEREDR